MKMRVLIVDDEPWARKRIATLLKPETDIEIVKECAGGEAAIQAITECAPDLVFLDVQMPEVDGFEVLDAIGPERMPLVIFATAYDKYAIHAFEAQAIDYLLKPFDEDRFRKALCRARRELDGKISSERALSKLLESMRGERRYLQRLVAKSGGRVLFLKLADIDWLEATGNYVTLHAGKESHMLRTTMNALEPRLDPEQFARIHRSSIVNLDRVRELQPLFRGEHVLILKDGTQL
ncbi:MAG TPA: LytTR family DNA-binding domain-containing protein, partial [Nitrospira sp.]